MKKLMLVLALALATSLAASPARNYFTDVVLTDQDGKPVRLYSDVLQGKTVVVESFFSTCTGTCPLMNATFAKIQNAVGDRLGKDVYLVSITVDAENDTPAKLKEYAGRMKARPGWMFLTGDKQNVDRALYKLGLAAESREAHKNLFIVGNEPKGVWKKVFGLGKADEIVSIVQGVIHER
ncbi:MAG TPA: SCO family protein [Thermoanaerobaculia bacterium]